MLRQLASIFGQPLIWSAVHLHECGGTILNGSVRDRNVTPACVKLVIIAKLGLKAGSAVVGRVRRRPLRLIVLTHREGLAKARVVGVSRRLLRAEVGLEALIFHVISQRTCVDLLHSFRYDGRVGLVRR